MRLRDILHVEPVGNTTPSEPTIPTPSNPLKPPVGAEVRDRPPSLTDPRYTFAPEREPDAMATGAVYPTATTFEGEALGALALEGGRTFELAEPCGLEANEPFSMEFVLTCHGGARAFADLFSSPVIPLRVQVRPSESSYQLRVSLGMEHEANGRRVRTWTTRELPCNPWLGHWTRLSVVWDGNDLVLFQDGALLCRRVYRAASWPFSTPSTTGAPAAGVTTTASPVSGAVGAARTATRSASTTGVASVAGAASAASTVRVQRSVVTLGSRDLGDVWLGRIRTWAGVASHLAAGVREAEDQGLQSVESLYEDLGPAVLGAVVSGPQPLADGVLLTAERGRVWWVRGVGAHAITGALATRHDELYRSLGPPLHDALPSADCQIVTCRRGALVETPRGVFAMPTALLTAWTARGAAEGELGVPLGDCSLNEELSLQDLQFSGGRLFATRDGRSMFIDRRFPLSTITAELLAQLGTPIAGALQAPDGTKDVAFGDLRYGSGSKTALLLCERGCVWQDRSNWYPITGDIYRSFVERGGFPTFGPPRTPARRVAYMGEVEEYVQVFEKAILYQRQLDAQREVIELTGLTLAIPRIHQGHVIDDGPWDSIAELYVKVSISVDGVALMTEQQYGPMRGYPSSVDLPIQLTIPVRPDTRIDISVNAWDWDKFDDDDWLGQMEARLDASNLWGLAEGDSNGFERVLTKIYGESHQGDAMGVRSVITLMSVAVDTVVEVTQETFRSRGFFHNFNHKSATLSRALYAAAFCDVNYMGDPLASLFNPLDELFYHIVKGIGSSGNCFGYSAESARAFHGLSHLTQPIYRYGWRTTFDHVRVLQAWQFGTRCILEFLGQLTALGNYIGQAARACGLIDRGSTALVSLVELGGPAHVVLAYAYEIRPDGTIILYVADINAPWGPPDDKFLPSTGAARVELLKSREREFSYIEVSTDNHVRLMTHTYTEGNPDREWRIDGKFEAAERFHSRFRGAPFPMTARIWMSIFPIEAVVMRPSNPIGALFDLISSWLQASGDGSLGTMWFCGDSGAPEQVSLDGVDLLSKESDGGWSLRAEAFPRFVPLPLAGAVQRAAVRKPSDAIPRPTLHQASPFRVFAGTTPIQGDLQVQLVGTSTGALQHAFVNGQTALFVDSAITKGRTSSVQLRDLKPSSGRVRFVSSGEHKSVVRWGTWADPHGRGTRSLSVELSHVPAEPVDFDVEPTGRVRIRQPRVSTPLSIELTQVHKGEEFVQRFENIQTDNASREVYLTIEAPGNPEGRLLVQSELGAGAKIRKLGAKARRL